MWITPKTLYFMRKFTLFSVENSWDKLFTVYG